MKKNEVGIEEYSGLLVWGATVEERVLVDFQSGYEEVWLDNPETVPGV